MAKGRGWFAVGTVGGVRLGRGRIATGVYALSRGRVTTVLFAFSIGPFALSPNGSVRARRGFAFSCARSVCTADLTGVARVTRGEELEMPESEPMERVFLENGSHRFFAGVAESSM